HPGGARLDRGGGADRAAPTGGRARPRQPGAASLTDPPRAAASPGGGARGGRGARCRGAGAGPPTSEAPAPPHPRSPPPPPPRPPPPPLLAPPEGDDAPPHAFTASKEAERIRDPKASRAARDRLLELRETLAIADLESVSLALLRGARVRAQGKDGAGAVELAQSAVALSPDVADTHWGLFRAHLGNGLFDLRRLSADAWNAGHAALADPRWSRGLLGDIGATVLVAWLATALAALLVLFLRTVPSLVHDVHHAFPKGVARWQAGALLILVL